jgi:hypothetical protein
MLDRARLLRRSARLLPLLPALAALAGPPSAAAYGWPVRPFNRAHPIRAAFGDPRYHVGAESQVSAFHFGVDVVAPDGTAVYAVEPGYVHARPTTVTVGRRSGRRFEYWHIFPVVRTGEHVRKHELLGFIRPGWGHVHFAESFRGAYKNPLRRQALTPYVDHTRPTVEFVQLVSPTGAPVNPAHVTGLVNIEASAFDTPQIPPPAPWQVARFAPAALWWDIGGPDAVSDSSLTVDFGLGLPANYLYNFIYAPGTYQNKPNRPGRYLFWLAQSLDTSALPDGTYQIEVFAEDTRGNIGTQTLVFQTANGSTVRGGRVAAGRLGPDLIQ